MRALGSTIERICRPMLEAGKQVMVLSAGALLPRPELIDLAQNMAGASSGRPARCSVSMRSLPLRKDISIPCA